MNRFLKTIGLLLCGGLFTATGWADITGVTPWACYQFNGSDTNIGNGSREWNSGGSFTYTVTGATGDAASKVAVVSGSKWSDIGDCSIATGLTCSIVAKAGNTENGVLFALAKKGEKGKSQWVVKRGSTAKEIKIGGLFAQEVTLTTPTEGFHHIAISISPADVANRVAIYIDGVKQDVSSYTVNALDDAFHGYQVNGTWGGVDGAPNGITCAGGDWSIDDLRIYTETLTDEQVKALYYAHLKFKHVLTFDGIGNEIDPWSNKAGEKPSSFVNTPHGKGFVVASGVHPWSNYSVTKPFSMVMYANIAPVALVTGNPATKKTAYLVACGNNGNHIALVKTEIDTVQVWKNGTCVEGLTITDPMLNSAESFHLFSFGTDDAGSFLQVDNQKVRGAAIDAPNGGFQIGSLYEGLVNTNTRVQGYGMIVDEVYEYGDVFDDNELDALAAYFPATYPTLSMEADTNQDEVISKDELDIALLATGVATWKISGDVKISLDADVSPALTALTLIPVNASGDKLTVTGTGSLYGDTFALTTDIPVDITNQKNNPTITLSGTGNVTIRKGQYGIAPVANNYTGTFTVDDGQQITRMDGALTIPFTVGANGATLHSNGSDWTVTSEISGSGTLTIESPDRTIYVTSNTTDFSGDVILKSGTLYLDKDKNSSVGNVFNNANTALIVKSGAIFKTHLTQNGTSNYSPNLILEPGAQVINHDGHMNYNGALSVNEGGNVDATSTYQLVYNKTADFKGVISGQGTLNLTVGNTQYSPHTVKISNENNTFSGTYHINPNNGNYTQLILEANGKMDDASVKMSKGQFKLMRDITSIVSLSGTEGVVTSNDDSTIRTLTLNGNSDVRNLTFTNVNLVIAAGETFVNANTVATAKDGTTVKVVLTTEEMLRGVDAETVPATDAEVTYVFLASDGSTELQSSNSSRYDAVQECKYVAADETWDGNRKPRAGGLVTIDFGETPGKTVDLPAILDGVTSLSELTIIGTNGGTITKTEGAEPIAITTTAINTNTFVDAGVASLGAVTIAANTTLTVSDAYENIISSLTNNGSLAFAGTESAPLQYASNTAEAMSWAKYVAARAGTYTFCGHVNVEGYSEGSDNTKKGWLRFQANPQTINIVNGANITATRLLASDGNGAATTITQEGGTITLKSDAVECNSTAASAILLGHWPATTNYNLKAGSLLAESGALNLGWDGNAHLTIGQDSGNTSALVSVKRLCTGSDGQGTRNKKSSVTINATGTLCIGDRGIDLPSEKAFTLAGGTLQMTKSAPITLAHSEGLKFTKNSTIDVAENATIAYSGKITGGSNTLTKTGSGELNLVNASGLDTLNYVVNGGFLILPAGAEGTADAAGNIMSRVMVNNGSTLVLQLSAEQMLEGYTAKVSEGTKVRFRDSSGDLIEGIEDGTYTPAVPTWKPTSADSPWAKVDLWNTDSVPEDGDIVIDTSALTAEISVVIPNAFNSISVKGNAIKDTEITFAEGVTTLPSLQIGGRVKLSPAVINGLTAISFMGDNAVLVANVTSDADLTKSLSGNFTFEKVGAGTLTLKANVSPDKGSVITEGIVKFEQPVTENNTVINETNAFGSAQSNQYLGATGDVIVKQNATLDVNGHTGAWLRYVTLEAGAKFVNNSNGAVGNTQRQCAGIILNGNATVHANTNFGILAGGYAASKLELNGYTLTKTGSGSFWLANTDVAGEGGTLKVEGGRFTQVNTAPRFRNIVFDSDLEAAFNLGNGAVTAPVMKKGTGALTIGGVISGEGAVTVEAGNLTLSGANTYTSGTVIAGGATLNAGTGSLGTGAVTGAGKLVVAGYPSNETVRNSLGAAEWTGRYVNTADNQMADRGNWFGAVGNENSEVEFSGASTGYLAAGGSSNFDLIVSGSITFSNGNSDGNNGYTFNGALLGEGTLATLNNQTDVLKFLGETKDFAGTITVGGGHCIAFGEQADDGTAEGKLVVAAGKTANVAAGKEWTADNGVEVSGTIGGKGTIASTLTLKEGATIDATKGAVTVTGAVMLPETGTVTVKVANYGDVLKVADADLDVFKFSLADGVAGQLLATSDALVYAPVIRPAEGETAVSDAVMAEVARAAGAEEVTTITAVLPDKILDANKQEILEVDVNGAELFNNVISFEDDGDNQDAKIAVVSYLFGISDVTVNAEGRIVVKASVDRIVDNSVALIDGEGEGETPAEAEKPTFVNGVTVALYNGDDPIGTKTVNVDNASEIEITSTNDLESILNPPAQQDEGEGEAEGGDESDGSVAPAPTSKTLQLTVKVTNEQVADGEGTEAE